MTRQFTDIRQSLRWEVLLACFFLLAAALHNGYPLVFSDTGTYVNSGFEGTIPIDRPIIYGLFIRHMSLAVTLWGPAIVQCLLMAWLLHVLLRPLITEKFTGMYLLIVASLCLITALPWYSGQLMPDIFTSMQLLVLAIVLTRPNISRLLWLALGILFVLSCLVHFSNLFIGLISLLGLLLVLWARPQIREGFPNWKKKSVVLLAWSVLAMLALPSINWLIDREFSLGKGGYTFIIGRMVDSGMLKMYLDDHCGEAKYRLCEYKDSLPQNSRAFHWDGNSPLYKEGGWGAPEAEYRAIVWGTLTSPKYLALHVWESVLSTPGQLMQNAIGSGLDYGWYRSPESPPYQVVQRYFPHEFNEYIGSRQCINIWEQGLDLDFFNRVNYWVLAATSLLLLWFMFIDKNMGQASLTPLLYVFLIGVFANAFITSSLAVLADRFSPRVVWLLSLWVLLRIQQRYKLSAS